MFIYRLFPFDFVVILCAIVRFTAVRLTALFALLFFGAVCALFLAADVRFLLDALVAAASSFSFAFPFRVLAAFFADVLLSALVCAMLYSQLNSISYSRNVNSFYTNE
jgi:hypothetical protein